MFEVDFQKRFERFFGLRQGVFPSFGIMGKTYPKTPGKLSTLSTLVYKQIVDNFRFLGKREVESDEDNGSLG